PTGSNKNWSALQGSMIVSSVCFRLYLLQRPKTVPKEIPKKQKFFYQLYIVSPVDGCTDVDDNGLGLASSNIPRINSTTKIHARIKLGQHYRVDKRNWV